MVQVERRPDGCTTVLCTARACCTPVHASLLAALGGVIRATVHGVLVTSGCVLGPLACGTRTRGPLVVVQPCDERRRPVGCAVLVGPVTTDGDVAAVGGWLRSGRLDPVLLPGHLRAAHRAVQGAVQGAERN